MLSMQGMLAKELKAQGLLPSKYDDLALPNKKRNVGRVFDTGREVFITLDDGSTNLLNNPTGEVYTLAFKPDSSVSMDACATLDVTASIQVNDYASLILQRSSDRYRSCEKLLEVVYNAPKNEYYGRQIYMDTIISDPKSANSNLRFCVRYNNSYSSGYGSDTIVYIPHPTNPPFELKAKFYKEAGNSPLQFYYSLDGTENWIFLAETSAISAEGKVFTKDPWMVKYHPQYKFSSTNFFYLRDLEVKQNGGCVFQRV